MIKDKLLQKELQAQILKDRNVQRAMDAEMEKHFLKEKKAMR